MNARTYIDRSKDQEEEATASNTDVVTEQANRDNTDNECPPPPMPDQGWSVVNRRRNQDQRQKSKEREHS